MSGPLVELSGVHTHIGAYHILHGVDLRVARGRLTTPPGGNRGSRSPVPGTRRPM